MKRPHIKWRPDPFGRDAEDPLSIPLRGWWQVVKRVWIKSSRDNFSVVAAGCAFFALFAVFPGLYALLSLYSLVFEVAHIEQHFEALAWVLPRQGYDIVMTEIARFAQASTPTLGWSLLISLVLAFWSASSGVQAMLAALNVAYEEEERRSFFHYYLNAFAFTLAGILGGLFVLLAIVYLPLVFAFAGAPDLFETLARVLRWPLLAVIVLVLLAILYRVGPCRRSAKWRWISVGSLFATSVWMVASALFSLYVSYVANYDRLYGSVGAVIILLFWLYLSFYIVLIGAGINAELELQTAEDTTVGSPKPMGKRGAYVADHVAGGPRDTLTTRQTWSETQEPTPSSSV
jgi:membrane protein